VEVVPVAPRVSAISLRLEIRQQGEVQVPILGEREVAPGAVDRDREELGIVLLELREDGLIQP
jgi:hypothetical protein